MSSDPSLHEGGQQKLGVPGLVATHILRDEPPHDPAARAALPIRDLFKGLPNPLELFGKINVGFHGSIRPVIYDHH